MQSRLILAVAVALLAAACGNPARGPCNPNPPPGTVGTICGFANPEDVEVVASAGLLLVSELRMFDGADGGSIMGLSLQPPNHKDPKPFRLWPRGGGDASVGEPAGEPSCVTPPPAAAFSPHGLTATAPDAGGVVRVAVVAHRVREAVELFDLAGAGEAATLTWRGCVPVPPDTAGNDVALSSDGLIVVSNCQPTLQGGRGFYYMLKGGLGGTTGDVMVWRRGHGWQHIPGTAAAIPNGVLVSADGATVFYAETGTGRVRRVPRAGLSPGREAESVTIGGNPDNLALTAQGTILAATHTDGAAGLLCAFGRLPCHTGWSIFDIDPVTLRATLLLHHDGSAVGAVASATHADGRFYFGSVFDDRIGVWQRGDQERPIGYH